MHGLVVYSSPLRLTIILSSELYLFLSILEWTCPDHTDRIRSPFGRCVERPDCLCNNISANLPCRKILRLMLIGLNRSTSVFQCASGEESIDCVEAQVFANIHRKHPFAEDIGFRCALSAILRRPIDQTQIVCLFWVFWIRRISHAWFELGWWVGCNELFRSRRMGIHNTSLSYRW